jgi:hypothetical protein
MDHLTSRPFTVGAIAPSIANLRSLPSHLAAGAALIGDETCKSRVYNDCEFALVHVFSR